jgi:hypothetical protein
MTLKKGVWSKDEIMLLTVHWKDGWTAYEISHEMKRALGTKRSRAAVIGKAHRLKLPDRTRSWRAAHSASRAA